MYVAKLVNQSGYLLWDEKHKRWAATQDIRIATRKTPDEWYQSTKTLIPKFKLINA